MTHLLQIYRWIIVVLMAGFYLSTAANAQNLVMATVDRAPFAMIEDSELSGFSIDLMRAVAAEIGRDVTFEMHESFSDMLGAVQAGQVDGAIANISITSEREEFLDFSYPIYEAGMQIMVPAGSGKAGSVLSALLRWELAASIAIAFALLFLGGMLMWVFERGKQDYFDRPAREALFPSFWWALNLVVNGGFEERVAQSRMGRVFSVLLVVMSLFIVSVFVAQITTAMTVQAISGGIENIRDLEGRRVATTESSTASAFLESRGIAHQKFAGLSEVLAAFEAGELDAVVFDSPLLAFYVQNDGAGYAQLVERIFKRENYGIALPEGSPLTEEINRALLHLFENGTYEEIRFKWFGGLR